MAEDLLQLVNEELLPMLAPLGFRIEKSGAAESFDNAFVILDAPALRIRVLRERSVVVLDVGPISKPNTWFDSAVVVEYLGLSTEGGFHDRDVRSVLRGIGAFITSMWSELTTKFAPEQFTATKRELETLQKQRAVRFFGD